jgi:hypothetical protein
VQLDVGQRPTDAPTLRLFLEVAPLQLLCIVLLRHVRAWLRLQTSMGPQ